MQSGTALVRASGGVRPYVRPDGRYMEWASASQLKLHELCERKWGFRYPFKMKPPRTRAFEFGEMIHTQLENYTESGTYPTHPLARAALPHIPKHGTIGVVGEYAGTLSSEPQTQVKIDLTDISTIGLVRITDYKTSSDEKYIPSPEELLQDTQAILYSYWAAQRYQVPVETTFLYLMKKGRPRAIPVTISPDVNYLLQQWEIRKARISYMRAQYILPTPKEFPGQPDAPHHPACQAFGGCPFKERCALIDGGRRRLFAGVSTAQTPKPVVSTMAQHQSQQTQEIQKLFHKLHPADQQKILSGSSVNSIDALLQLQSPNLNLAHEAMRQWVNLPSPEHLEEKAAKCSFELPRPALQLHPLERKKLWEMMPSGFINPPDGGTSQTPKKPDPKDQPITDVPKIGDTVAERMAEALGMAKTEITTIAQVAIKGLGFHKEVTGLSKTKMKEIIELCPEAIAEHEEKQKKAMEEVEKLVPPEPPLTKDEEIARLEAALAALQGKSTTEVSEVATTEPDQPTSDPDPEPNERLVLWTGVAHATIESTADGFHCGRESERTEENIWEVVTEQLWFKSGLNDTFSEDIGRIFVERLAHWLSYRAGESL